MAKTPVPSDLVLHQDADLFRESLDYTARRTGFVPRLIEKDYFCTLLLAQLGSHVPPTVVFKGGTCLAKVHAGFYRLSEDLDFAEPIDCHAKRSQRSKRVAAFNQGIKALVQALPVFQWIDRMVGRNNSTQYIGTLGYASVLTGETETIKVEVSLREPLLTPLVTVPAATLLISPLSGNPAVRPVPVRCISRIEAMAEKFRAALTRRDVAIRDFYDLHYAVKNLGLRAADPALIDLVRKKLAVPGNDAVNLGDDRLAALRAQLDTQLKPVLRGRDFDAFDLDTAFSLIRTMAAAVA